MHIEHVMQEFMKKRKTHKERTLSAEYSEQLHEKDASSQQPTTQLW